jgi:hypothetical protein
MNPRGAAKDLSNATATITLGGGEVVSALPLNERGVGKSDRGAAPSVKVSYKHKNGALAVSIRKADLRQALGFADEDATGTVDVDVAVTISGAGLATSTVAGTLRCGMRNRAGKSAKATFKHAANDALDGVFKSLRTTGTERPDGQHRVSFRGAIAAPDGEALAPVSGLTVTIGGAPPIVVPQASLSTSATRTSYSRSQGEVAGLLRLQIDHRRKQLTLATDDLAIGLPATGAAAETSAELAVRVDVELASGPSSFGTTVELLRKSGTSKRWAR